MTELIEQVAFGTVGAGDADCPFDHDGPPGRKDSIDNDLVGVGSTLGENMEAGKSSLQYPGAGRAEKIPYPKKKAYPIEIGDWLYPVTCAAHHLIPAQASLREAKGLLSYMISKHVAQPLKKKGSRKGKLWSDIGYDVNGAQNGVWLPGNYAVTGSGGFWEPADSADDDDDEAVAAERRHAATAAKRQPGSAMLVGALHDVDDPNNKKYQYVNQATRLFNAQFHDSHGLYSDFVLKALMKIGVAYKSAERRFIVETACKKCEKRMKGRENDGLPPPFGLARRLNGVSGRLKAYLVGRQGDENVYTSRWGKAIAHKT